ncbi:50S ribosomal protein L24 [Candidatus Woesebacteria bacterium]|nr:50S ribosomal protein L24 [Candidatus Woesebacteria bacterium]
MKIRVNDTVQIQVGKDKGKQGKVLTVLPRQQKLIIEGINLVVRHRKPQQGQSGERVSLTKPIDVSKVAVLNRAGEVDRIGYKVLKDGSKVRIFKKSGEEVTTVEKVAKPAKKVSEKTTEKKVTKAKKS